MKNIFILFFLWVPASCTTLPIQPGNQIRCEHANVDADNEIHTAIVNLMGSEQEIFGAWMHHIITCRGDSSKIISLANTSAAANRFWMFEVGMIKPIILGEENRREEICSKYNIKLYQTGCHVKYNCWVYNDHMQKIVQQQKGIDYDSLIAEIYTGN